MLINDILEFPYKERAAFISIHTASNFPFAGPKCYLPPQISVVSLSYLQLIEPSVSQFYAIYDNELLVNDYNLILDPCPEK